MRIVGKSFYSFYCRWLHYQIEDSYNIIKGNVLVSLWLIAVGLKALARAPILTSLSVVAWDAVGDPYRFGQHPYSEAS